jgi:hypothetical protein
VLAVGVATAIEQLQVQFPDSPIAVREDGEGGAYVILESIPLGPPYVQASIWIGFRITAQYPYADVYPHYVPSALSREDGRPLASELQRVDFEGRPAFQISRRSNRLNPAADTAGIKLQKVLTWLLSRP